MDWTQIIIAIISLVIAPAMLLLIKEGFAYLKVKAGAVVDENARKRIEHYLDLALQAVSTAVLETSQTFVDSIKGTDGWTSATMQEAFLKSKDRAIEIMGRAVYDGLSEGIDDVNKWIEAQIEATVHQTKVTVLTPLITSDPAGDGA